MFKFALTAGINGVTSAGGVAAGVAGPTGPTGAGGTSSTAGSGAVSAVSCHGKYLQPLKMQIKQRPLSAKTALFIEYTGFTVVLTQQM